MNFLYGFIFQKWFAFRIKKQVKWQFLRKLAFLKILITFFFTSGNAFNLKDDKKQTNTV